jgi:tetratricopeptide (TPR) repeat protein
MKSSPQDESPSREGIKPSGSADRAQGVPVYSRDTELELLACLEDEQQDHQRTWHQLAVLYSDTGRYDRALSCLRELMTLEPELERKAACVLAMGANAEKQQDFEAAVRFYQEALAMEPTHAQAWYFIHNNLGYSLNRLGRFGEGETFCRAAIEINPRRPNGHKNLGIALSGQGRHKEAAQCFIAATKVNSGDPRSLDLLRDLLRQHEELEFEFGPELARCEEVVKFVTWAIQRAMAGNSLKILLGCNDSSLDVVLSHILLSMTGGAVRIYSVSDWSEFIERACSGTFDLGFVIPSNLQLEEAGPNPLHQWALAERAIWRIKGNSSMVIVVGGDSTELCEHGQACREAGLDDVIELPFSADMLADTLRRLLLAEA